jgi:D-2-hydroxyacid dehydrogenase (NADP+)
MTTILVAHRDAAHYGPRLKAAFPQLDIRSTEDRPATRADVGEADVIVAVDKAFSDDWIARAPRLRWIQAMTTGTDAILAMRRLPREVVVTTTWGIHGPQMSEMAFMHMLNLARDYPRMLANQKQKIFKRWTQTRLYGKTAVVVGVGAIAREFAARAKAFGMTVIGVTRTPREVPGFDRMMTRAELGEAAGLADFLVLLVPYERDTDGLIGARVLAAMKPSAFLINISRGGVLDEDALVEALRAKRIAGAGLDVFRTEPLPKDHPFWEMHNVTISAHCAGSSDVNTELTWSIIEKNLVCFLEGRWSEMQNLVAR